jgi:hypothetical protein
MAIFNSYVKLPEGNYSYIHHKPSCEATCKKPTSTIRGTAGKYGPSPWQDANFDKFLDCHIESYQSAGGPKLDKEVG